jgi:hypothetical protein
MNLNEKMRPVETIPRMGERGIKENDGGVNSSMTYCGIFVNATRYPNSAQQYK